MSVQGSKITVRAANAVTLAPLSGVAVAVSPQVFLTADMTDSPVSSVVSNGVGDVVCWALPGTYSFTPAEGAAIKNQVVDDTLGGDVPESTVASLTAMIGSKLSKAENLGDVASVPTARASLHIEEGTFQVKVEGALGNGSDDSAVFEAAYARALAAVVAPYSGIADDRGRIEIVVPPGRYTLTQDAALMNAVTSGRYYGFNLKGTGRALTEIVYAPTTSGRYLFRNHDMWRGLTIEGITFIGAGTSPNFFDSESAGGAQDYRFKDVEWDGSWVKGLDLTGTDTNSEFAVDDCSILGTWADAFLNLGTDEVSSSEDEFLNYWFTKCRIILNSGNLVSAYRGGSITLRDSSAILLGAGKFFDFPFATHADSVQRLEVDGVRFETRDDASMLIDSHWGAGVVKFSNSTNSSEAVSGDPTAVRARFTSESTSMPAITMDSGEWEGQHEYAYSALSCNGRTKIKYSNGKVFNYADPRDFIKYTALGSTTNAGGTPLITFQKMHGSTLETDTPPASQFPFDGTVGWDVSNAGGPSWQSERFANNHGDSLPITGTPLDKRLPKYAIPTRLRIYKPAGTGADTSVGTTYTLQTNEATPTVLAVVTNDSGAQWKDWLCQAIAEIPPMTLVNDLQRHVSLVAANATSTTQTPAFAILEYLA